MANSNLILAIETSNPTSGPRGRSDKGHVLGPGVALGSMQEHCVIIGDEPLAETARHDDDLLPAISRVFEKANAQPSDLAVVAVSVGPGGYTGVRIAVAAAKLIAEASGAKTVAVKSSLAGAWGVEAGSTAAICLASKNDMTHATLLPYPQWWTDRADAINQIASQSDFLHATTRIAEGKVWLSAACTLGVINVEHFERIKPNRLIADKFLPEPIREWANQSGIEIIEPVFSPAFVLQIGRHQPPVDPAELAPVYPREPDAVRQWRLRKSGNQSPPSASP